MDETTRSLLDRVAEHGEMDLVADLARPVPATLICKLLGAHLARLEAEIAIGFLVQRFDQLELVDETTEWGRSLFRVPARIPIKFSEAARSAETT